MTCCVVPSPVLSWVHLVFFCHLSFALFPSHLSSTAAFEKFKDDTQKFLLLPQRLERAFEVINAVERGRQLGVHLSGPNGVGKSAIALLVYLLCVARGLPAFYIWSAEPWVRAARVEGGGDAFALETFWRQNADLIIANPALRKVFVGAMNDSSTPFTTDVMQALREAVGTPSLPGLAAITDEVQHITKAVRDADLPTATAADRTAGVYFRLDWYTWTNANKVFQRMSVASAHADRDTKLPDGEDHRLRIIEPLDPEDRSVLQSASASPAYVKDPAARERVVYIGGNILRKLVKGSDLLPRNRSPTKDELVTLWETMWRSMEKDCESWWATVPEKERDDTANMVMDLVSGSLLWASAPILYDAGIVYRSSLRPNIYPISAVASAVILRVTGAHISINRKTLSTIPDGRERGLELERQVLSRLDRFASREGVPVKLLDGTPAERLELQCGYSLPFSNLSEVIARDVPVLYRPISLTYPCDGIRMPAVDDPDGKVCFIECSTTDPVLASRVEKVQKWLEPEGVVTKLLSSCGRQPVFALFYDGVLKERGLTAFSAGARALTSGKLPTSAMDAGSSAAASDLLVRLGDVVRVIDSPSLVNPLGLSP